MSEEPLTTTFTQLRKGFLKLASRFLPDEEDAEDALQDTFCRLWPRRHQIHSSQEAEALAVTTLRNLCIDQVRKEKVPLMELDAERDVRPAESIEERIEKEELFREVNELINKELSPDQLLESGCYPMRCRSWSYPLEYMEQDAERVRSIYLWKQIYRGCLGDVADATFAGQGELWKRRKYRGNTIE